MSIPITLTDKIQNELKFLQDYGKLCEVHGIKPTKYNIISVIAEKIVALDTNGRVDNKQKIIDVIAGDGRTIQVKSCNQIRDEVTINYTENKPVDLLAIVEFSTGYQSVSYLYFGPFKEFIESAQNMMQLRGDWDNHRTLKKKFITRLQNQYGFNNNPSIKPKLYEFL